MNAFDALAATYDQDFTHTQIGKYLRNCIRGRLLHHWSAGDRILEIGCGTGEDALFLAQHGIHVIATDASEEMLAATRKKTSKSSLIDIEHFDINNLSQEKFQDTSFDGIFSNFGALNCTQNWQSLAQWLAKRLKPNGIAGFCIMSPICLWEIGWHGIHLNFNTATRRLRNTTTFQPDDKSVPIKISYPSIQQITQDFAPCFQRAFTRGIGIFLPPSDVYSTVEKHPRLLTWLTQLEERFSKSSKLAMFADHYWIEFRRKN